jgi:hypothetical protein
MEKRIAIWSYWLGVLCTVLTIVLRGLAAFGVFPILVPASSVKREAAVVGQFGAIRSVVPLYHFQASI